MNLHSPERAAKSQRPQLTIKPNLNRPQVSRRRSSRMALNAPVELSGNDRQKCAFTVRAKATALNRHGAAVQLNRELLVGSTVVVRNQRGAIVPARVVAQLAAFQGVLTYAIEFLEKDDKTMSFWGITFPSNSE